ncbi:hypothetical protein [Sphingobium sp. Ant17]|uniref:hypothetical protein n=1 Tax=Sphingobium sp. Ant17 TaxID=1461752 RepID=UPI001267E671|nr:hypothetical protein [Sphingobium sp. Ant17]
MTDRTIYSAYIQPAADFIIKFGEAIVLSVFFQIAAERTNNVAIDIANVLVALALGAYAGLPVGLLVMKPLSGRTTKHLLTALAITIPLSIFLAWIAFQIGFGLREIVAQLTKITT